MPESAFTKAGPLTIDDIVVISFGLCQYAIVHRAITSGELPAEVVDGRYVITRAAAELWIASRRGRTSSRGSSATALTIEEVVALSAGKETFESVRRAIALGDLVVTPARAELPAAVSAAIDAGELPGVESVEVRPMIETADATAWLARTAPAGITVDDVVALGAGRVTAATVHKAIGTGELAATRFGSFWRIAQSDASTWIAAMPAGIL